MFHLAKTSLANRALVGIVTIFIALFGLISMMQLKQELIPSIELPQATVVTVVPGAGPEVMDEQVGEPVSRAVTNLSGVEEVISTSSANLSIVQIAYEYGQDPAEFETSVRRSLDGLADVLPSGADPTVIAGSTADMPILFLTAADPKSDDASLTDLVGKVIVPQLEAVTGVRAVDVSGGASKQVTITPDPLKMSALGVSPAAIPEAVQKNGNAFPLGTVKDGDVSLQVQGGSPLDSLKALESLPVPTAEGKVAQIRDFASVELETLPSKSITRMNGLPAISLSVTARQGGDIVAISSDVNKALDELRADKPELELTVVFDQAPFIQESIKHLAIEGLLGLLFAVAVILLFLRSATSTLVTAISIPLSVLVAFVGLNLGGYSLNMLTLGALTIAIGRVVDDSIVVVENIKRHLSYGTEKIEAILTGVREVAGAVTASTLTTVAVFVPIATVGGLVGELFAPFALTVTIAMLSSLVVALTIVPVLSYWFLRRPAASVSEEEVRLMAEEKEHRSLLQRGYRPIFAVTQRHPVATFAAAGALLVGTVALVPFLKIDFLGDTGQNAVLVTQEFPAGTSLETISEGAASVEKALEGVEGVEDVLAMAGSGEDEMAAMFGGGSSATFMVTTDQNANQVVLEDRIRAELEALEGPGEAKLMDMAAMSGFGGTVDVKVTSIDEAQLSVAADKVFKVLADVSETLEVANDLAPDEATVRVEVNRKAALRAGYSEVELLGMVAGTLSPRSIGNVTVDAKEYSVLVNTGTAPQTPADLGVLPLPTTTGMATLGDLAEIKVVTGPVEVTRDSGDLVATVSLTPKEGELGTVTSEVNKRLESIELPEGTSAKIGGLADQQQDAFNQLGLAMLAAVAIVFVLLVATFRSLVQPLILLVSIPFAATGAIGLLLVTGRPLGISALIGMLMLIGIVVTNAIVLIDLVNQYRRAGQSLEDALMHGARQRLRPILMTAIATIFALVPMALGVTGSSGFISQDLAIVVIGGLTSSTVLTLVLVPVLYRLFEQRRARRSAGSAVAA